MASSLIINILILIITITKSLLFFSLNSSIVFKKENPIANLFFNRKVLSKHKANQQITETPPPGQKEKAGNFSGSKGPKKNGERQRPTARVVRLNIARPPSPNKLAGLKMSS